MSAPDYAPRVRKILLAPRGAFELSGVRHWLKRWLHSHLLVLQTEEALMAEGGMRSALVGAELLAKPW
jgi:hypothetical protein